MFAQYFSRDHPSTVLAVGAPSELIRGDSADIVERINLGSEPVPRPGSPRDPMEIDVVSSN